jgi:formylglycine-generating enzyme required for sulfatase activity
MRFDASFCRSAHRNAVSPGGRDSEYGFRLALSPE